MLRLWPTSSWVWPTVRWSCAMVSKQWVTAKLQQYRSKRLFLISCQGKISRFEINEVQTKPIKFKNHLFDHTPLGCCQRIICSALAKFCQAVEPAPMLTEDCGWTPPCSNPIRSLSQGQQHRGRFLFRGPCNKSVHTPDGSFVQEL